METDPIPILFIWLSVLSVVSFYKDQADILLIFCFNSINSTVGNHFIQDSLPFFNG